MSRGSGHEPTRTCIVCGARRFKRDLLRMVLQDGFVMLDRRMKLPGRGAYCCNNDRCPGLVLDNYRHCLNRAFRTKRVDTVRLKFVADRSSGRCSWGACHDGHGCKVCRRGRYFKEFIKR